VSNNIWTFGQQHLVFGKIEKEEEAQKQEELVRRSASAPAPGAKPQKGRKGVPAEVAEVSDDDQVGEFTKATGDSDSTPSTAAKSAGANGAAKSGTNGAQAPSGTPRPGARPKKRKRQR
jgi:YidC/Oxa1 family membrane protein insertase